ncbi:lysophospholipase [Rhizobium sp. P40RR-XXII]|uniref:alpha/beta hydrolase family protein n=1 Tax=Rhizobium sp. P40RR-XXII TaxID=2726739 RepID=UPI0014572C58|nr:lipase family protein [Rhizobium sp. P40RR-XXII]NLS20686.1 lysophospholipase [Rhizobium sp. P40RR-XXII]
MVSRLNAASPLTRMSRSRAPDSDIDMYRRALLIGAGATVLYAGTSPVLAASRARGRQGIIDRSCRVSASRLDSQVAKAYPLFNKPVVLPDFDPQKHGARSDVALHRLVTETVVPETRERLKISGLLAVPVGAKGEVPLVSWQHGTILSFDQVPSNLTRLADPAYEMSDADDSLETLFNVQRLAGRGFAVVAADYVGKGPFRKGRGEGYAVKGVSIQTCLDVLAAGRAAMRSLGLVPSRLFLHGWSQGALNTQWLHQALRAEGQSVAATAVASPFNDLNEAWSFWAGRETFPLPEGMTSYPAMPGWISLCMIVALGSYELQYGLTGLLRSAVRPEFQELAAHYWKTYDNNFDQKAPFPTGSNLLVPGFFDHATDDRNSAFLRHLAANRSSYWNYDAPIRFYHGLADEAVHPVMVARALSAGGKFATGVPVENASHRGTFLSGLYGDAKVLGEQNNIVDWFGSFR